MSEEPDGPFDPLPGLRAEIDQALEMASDLARMAKAWYDAFIEQGFAPRQALYLTAVQMKGDPGDPPDA